MDENPTTSDLFKAQAITSDEVDAAVDVVLAKPDLGAYPIGGGYLLDLGAAIQAHTPSATALADPRAGEKFQRIMARTAILLTRPADHFERILAQKPKIDRTSGVELEVTNKLRRTRRSRRPPWRTPTASR